MTPQEAVEYLFGATGEADLKRVQHVECQKCKDILLAALADKTSDGEQEEGTGESGG